MPRFAHPPASGLTTRWALGALALPFWAAGLAGCSVSVPIAPLRASAEDATGSIPKPATVLSRRLDAEDWRRAKAAMGTALDPQGDGANVEWSNGQTGARGGFTSVARAYPDEGRICRAFLAKVETAQGVEELQGTACRDGSGEWELGDVRAWKG